MRRKSAAISLGVLLACCPCASALNPSLDIDQYAHAAWTSRDGFFKGIILDIAQTPDGYLWLATEFGLLRFDGVHSVPWQAPPGERLPSNIVSKLFAAHDGRLWIGTRQGLASWKDGKLTRYPELAGQWIQTIVEDRKQTVWAGGFGTPAKGRLCAIRDSRVQCYGDEGKFRPPVDYLYEDSGGNLWAVTQAGLWRWKPDPPVFYPLPDTEPEIYGLAESGNGRLLIATHGGMRQLVDGKIEPYPIPGLGTDPIQMLQDREGSLWIGTLSRGLLHVHQGRTDVFAKSDGLSGDYIERLFEDREGNIWVATLSGLDRFREFAATTISVRQGLSNPTVMSVQAAREGGVWLGTYDGLDQWNDGQISIYRNRKVTSTASSAAQGRGQNGVREIAGSGLPGQGLESIFEDDRGRLWISTRHGVAYLEHDRFIPIKAIPGGQVYFITGDGAGGLWFSHDLALIHLLASGVVEQIPWARLGRKDFAYTLCHDPVRGGLWLGFAESGVAYFKDGGISASYASADGLGEGQVKGLQLDPDGTLWAVTAGGLSRLSNGRIATLTSRSGLPCDTVHWMMEDNAHSVWLGMTCGLVRLARSELDQWSTDPKRTVRATLFDSSDGVVTHSEGSGYSPRAAKSADGKLWFLPYDGVSVIDPRHLPFNKLSPPVHIEQITAGQKTYDAISHLRLPPRVRDLEIDYTALSLVAPEKIRFRYRLEGYDRDWRDVGNRRQAFYNDLAPQSYRFRVIACNDSGVWSEVGDSFDFSIDPAYYQTRWFQASCAATFLALLWALYRYRLHQIAEKFNANLEGRVDERLRVARELHDTLLQSFQGLMLHFQIGVDRLPPSETKEVLEKALEVGDRAIVEGREAIHDLRSSTVVENDLAKALRALGDELATGHSATFRLIMEGPSRNLHPILRDEIYRIAREAVRNAFNHSQASHIEAEIHYGEKLLRLRIRDDGRGIDPNIVAEGRTGHYGLPGMRERARNIGGQLKVWTATGAGTEIDLTIPASIAYGTSLGRRTWWHRLQPVQSVPPEEES